MSRTIITESGSKFFTNINAEQLLGELCKKVGAKYFPDAFGARLAYSMTKEEVIDTIQKLRTLEGKEDEAIVEFVDFFEKGSTAKDFRESLQYYIGCFEKSEGYKCI